MAEDIGYEMCDIGFAISDFVDGALSLEALGLASGLRIYDFGYGVSVVELSDLELVIWTLGSAFFMSSYVPKPNI